MLARCEKCELPQPLLLPLAHPFLHPPTPSPPRLQPKRIENAKILVANTAMDTDKIKIYGARVRVDSMSKVRSHPGEGRAGQ